MVAGIVDLGREGHRGRGEVLNLFEMQIEFFGLGGKLGHVDFAASGMGGYEVGDQLLSEPVARVYAVKEAAEFMIELERGLAHKVEHSVGGVFRRHFQTSGDVAGDQLFIICAVCLVYAAVASVVHGKIIAHAAADE